MAVTSAVRTLVVTPELTAATVGSGLLPVFATPMAAAFMESTACLCLDSLPEGETTVGVRIDIQHLKASAVGETLTCRATLVSQKERRYWFDIRVLNARGEEVAIASHERVRVDSGRFMAKVQAAVQ